MERYALIHTVMPRELVLLQGQGCKWKQCTFCDYHTDVSQDPRDRDINGLKLGELTFLKQYPGATPQRVGANGGQDMAAGFTPKWEKPFNL